MKKHKFGHGFSMIWVILFMSVGAILSGLVSIRMGTVTDAALLQDMTTVMAVAKTTLILSSIGLIVRLFNNYFEKKYLESTLRNLKSDYMEGLLKLSPVQLYQLKGSDYISNLTHDMDRLETQYYQNLLRIVSLVISLIVSIVILVRIWWGFIIVSVILGAIFVYLARKTSKPVKKEEKKKSQALVQYTNFVEESLLGFEVITQHQLEKSRHDKFEKLSQNLKSQQYQVEKKMTLVDGLNGGVQSLIIAVLMVLGLLASVKTGMSLGETLVVIMMFSNLIFPIQRLTPMITEMNAISELFDTFDNNLKVIKTDGDLTVSKFDGFKFESGSLGYDQPILKDVNFEILKHEKVLIVGPSGAGKSTLLKTLLRQVEPLAGTLSLNRHNIKDISLDHYYQLMSIVDQIGFIFSGSVQENVSLLGNGSTHAVLDKVKMGYLNESKVLKNDGSNLSGGERARLLLARSHFFDKEVILCDEILSALDQDVARTIESDVLDTDKTVINISHIVFEDNLEKYDKFLIVDQGSVKVSYDKDEILSRMLEYDLLAVR